MFIGTVCIVCNTVECEEGKQFELTVIIFSVKRYFLKTVNTIKL